MASDNLIDQHGAEVSFTSAVARPTRKTFHDRDQQPVRAEQPRPGGKAAAILLVKQNANACNQPPCRHRMIPMWGDPARPLGGDEPLAIASAQGACPLHEHEELALGMAVACGVAASGVTEGADLHDQPSS